MNFNLSIHLEIHWARSAADHNRPFCSISLFICFDFLYADLDDKDQDDVNVDGHKQPGRTSLRDDGFREMSEVSEGLENMREWD